MFSTLDIAVIVAWLLLSFGAGLWFTRRASRSNEDFFVAGRSLPWWVVGTSMVATTFAADTPLAVSGWVASEGVHHNWIWWTFGLTGTVAVFLFAPLWNRSGVITDAELVELRYGPGVGRWLRRFKAIWFGVFWNALVMAWVIKAMVKIGGTVLGWAPDATTADVLGLAGPLGGLPASSLIVGALFVVTVGYTVASGLWGVVATDLMQFAMAMISAVALAGVAWWHMGGLSGAQAGFAEHGFDWEHATALIPPLDMAPDGATLGFAMLVGILWWSGTNVDGGSYLAQRLLSAKDDRHALWAYLWFTVAHIVLRPWPWIVVGIAGMALLGPVSDAETYYPRMMAELLPSGLFGLMVASFLAAFMSTIDTQLNWGASLLVNDFWEPLKRWMRGPRDGDDTSDNLVVRLISGEVTASRTAIVLLAVVGAVASFLIDDIGAAWKLAISITAGLGSTYIARWMWWRTNGWSEISAMLTAAVLTVVFMVLQARHPEVVQAAVTTATASGEIYAGPSAWAWLGALPQGWLAFPFSAAFTALVSVPIWVSVTLLTPPPPRETLAHFAATVRPSGPGWPVELRGPSAPWWSTLLGIGSGMLAIYGALLGSGWVLFGHLAWGLPAIGLSIAGAVICGYSVRRAITASGGPPDGAEPG